MLLQVIKVFLPSTKIVLELLGRNKPSYIPEKDLAEIQTLIPYPSVSKEDFFSYYAFIGSALALVMNGGLRSGNKRKEKFEEQMAAENVVPEIIQIMNGDIGE